jgi:hypothetical protein
LRIPHINVVKANGEITPFDILRLRESLHRSGASEETIDQVVEYIIPQLEEGMTTHRIYRMAYKQLKRVGRKAAPRYSLKHAIMEMGPSGYPFEHLVARIFERNGYQTQVGAIRKGHCVQHEVDVLAIRGEHCYAIECKFHNRPGYVSDVKVPLYIQSRFLDIQAGSRNNGNGPEITQGWVVTNTRFSSDAIDYAKCMNLVLVGWDFPEVGSLKDRIEKAGLYPLTVLTNLKKSEMQHILENKVVTCTELLKNQHVLEPLKIGAKRLEAILAEAKELCGGDK